MMIALTVGSPAKSPMLRSDSFGVGAVVLDRQARACGRRVRPEPLICSTLQLQGALVRLADRRRRRRRVPGRRAMTISPVSCGVVAEPAAGQRRGQNGRGENRAVSRSGWASTQSSMCAARAGCRSPATNSVLSGATEWSVVRCARSLQTWKTLPTASALVKRAYSTMSQDCDPHIRDAIPHVGGGRCEARYFPDANDHSDDHSPQFRGP